VPFKQVRHAEVLQVRQNSEYKNSELHSVQAPDFGKYPGSHAMHCIDEQAVQKGKLQDSHVPSEAMLNPRLHTVHEVESQLMQFE
jgi:hypothetical protein